MYDLRPALEHATVDPGTNILVAGPPLTGKRRLALEVLAEGAEHDEGAVFVTTRDRAERVIDELNAVCDDAAAGSIGVVDCVTQHQGGSPRDTPEVKYASSPVDMTGIGIQFSEFVEEFTRRGHESNRIVMDSITALLMYTDLQTVFRFMHVFTGRIESADALGVHLIESTAHDDETMTTLNQLFDGVVETDEGREVSIQLPGT